MSESPDFGDDVREEIERLGSLEAYASLLAKNDALIRSEDLAIGQKIAAERTAIHTGVMAHWAEKARVAFGYERPFAVVALGGTGREEMTPCSDTDFAFLCDDEIDGNSFLLELQRQTLTSGEFRRCCGYSTQVLSFNLDDMPDQKEKQLNSFLDMKSVYDPDGLAVRFRDRIRESYDPFEHFLHVSQFWRDHWGTSDARPERLDKFDIKNEGLRVFLAGVWSLAGSEFRHSHEIYREIDCPRVIEAYYFLLRVRSFIHARINGPAKHSITGNHDEDIMEFEDFTAFGELLGESASESDRFEFSNEVRGKLVTARRRVEQFTKGVIGNILSEGRPIRSDSAIVYGAGGLRDTASDREDDHAKSRAAMAVLLAAQRHDLPVDPVEMTRTFYDADDWLVPVPEVSELFHEARGSLARTLEILASVPGATERLFPGFDKFESSIDQRVMSERKSLRGALVRQKIAALEKDVLHGRQLRDDARNTKTLDDTSTGVNAPVEAALLKRDELAAVKLALQTKRLPETVDDIRIREDESRPLHDRFSSGFSGIPLEDYFGSQFESSGFNPETLELVTFLVGHRRLFKECAANDLMDPEEVNGFIKACDEDETRIRALFVFTCADRADWECEQDDPALWSTIRELYGKAIRRFRPGYNPLKQLAEAGFDSEEQGILEGFGRSFFSGRYGPYASRYGSHLLKLAGSREDRELPAKVDKIRIDSSEVLVVAAHDQPGIAASICGALWKQGIALSAAHLFSAREHGIALDFFHLAPRDEISSLDERQVLDSVREAIAKRLYLGPDDEGSLPDSGQHLTLEHNTSGDYQLRAETTKDVGGLMYFLTCKAHCLLEAQIYGLAAHTGRSYSWVSIYLGLPEGTSLEEGRRKLGL